jgi:RNA polymerase sigma factor (sigma-70 family)
VASGPSKIVPKYLSALFEDGTPAGLGDRELLERFAGGLAASSEAAEAAFAALVARHGAMVLRVCRAVLGDRHEAEDAFQATFLVLASRARSIRRGDSVGSWLHGVALRVSARARSRAARRRHHERRRAEMTNRATEAGDGSPSPDADLDRVVQEEIGRLPEKFRAAVVLCYIEGLTHETAAAQLGCPVGTIRSRLSSARERLQRRLIRRGVAPMAVTLAGPASLLESVPTGVTVPAALTETTIRGALRIGMGHGALAGIVSAEAVALTEGVLKTMMISKLTLVATTILVAGLMTTGAALTAYWGPDGDGNSVSVQAGGSGPSPTTTQKEASKPAAGQTPPPQVAKALAKREEVMKKLLQMSEDRVKALIRDYESQEQSVLKALGEAKGSDEMKALQSRRPNEASFAGALLYQAELNPGTPPAEEALVWIVTHLRVSSMAERAKEMLIRDHIRSDKIEPVFQSNAFVLAWGSKATERLLREALAQNPHRRIQALACYHLARFLSDRAGGARNSKMLDEAQQIQVAIPINRESWGYDYEERLRNADSEALEREAISLYERVVKEFGDTPLPNPLPHPTGDRLLPGGPTTYGEAARSYLRELRDLGLGRPAPEIRGVDLDGKPMKLSDYRGKVVALYFCGPVQLSADGTGKSAMVTEEVREVAERHANDPFVLLGVTTVSPGRRVDREGFRALLKASGLPARFWWDLEPDGKPGPIQAAWNARIGLHVIDGQGTIRYKHALRADLLEKALTALLKERGDKPGGPAAPRK